MSQKVQIAHKQRLPALDGMRGIAFFMVFLGHAFKGELASLFDGSPSLTFEYLKLGHLGLDFFFVLSGFLITRVIYQEWKTKKRFSFGNFMARRALRIWPLYFLLLAISLLALCYLNDGSNTTSTVPNMGWFATFTANFKMAFDGADFFFPLVILWSISVEEQFYLLWATLGKWFKKILLPVSILLIVGSIVFRWMSDGDRDLQYFHSLSVAGNFALGFLAAWAVHHFPRWREKLEKTPRSLRAIPYTVLLLLLATHPFVFTNTPMVAIERFLFGGLFAWIVLDQCFVQQRLVFPKWLIYTGKISYGLYGFHALAIVATFSLADHLQWTHPVLLWGVIPFLSLALTYFAAAISWHGFEAPLLRLKRFFY